MRGRDDDMMSKCCRLAENFRLFGVELPSCQMADGELPSAYFDEVSTSISSGKKRWTVRESILGLGFFTFSKFLMWRNFDPPLAQLQFPYLK